MANRSQTAVDVRVDAAKFVDVINGWAAIYTDGLDINLSPEVTKAVVAAFVADEETRRGASA